MVFKCRMWDPCELHFNFPQKKSWVQKKNQSQRLQLDEVSIGEVLTIAKSWHINFKNHIGTNSYIYIILHLLMTIKDLISNHTNKRFSNTNTLKWQGIS